MKENLANQFCAKAGPTVRYIAYALNFEVYGHWHRTVYPVLETGSIDTTTSWVEATEYDPRTRPWYADGLVAGDQGNWSTVRAVSGTHSWRGCPTLSLGNSLWLVCDARSRTRSRPRVNSASPTT